MNRAIITCSMIVILSATAVKSFGQLTDSTAKKAILYLSQRLQSDTSTAHKVIYIQESYKQAVKQVINNNSLTEVQKRTAIDGLIDNKNQRLMQLLNPNQLELLIPTTEKRRSWQRDTTANTTH